MSDQAAALFGCAADELLGHTVEELVPDDVRAAHRAHRTRYQAEPTVRSMGAGLLLRARRTDGSEFPVEISLSPLSMGGDTYTVAALRTSPTGSRPRTTCTGCCTPSTPPTTASSSSMPTRCATPTSTTAPCASSATTATSSWTMTPLHLNPTATEADYRHLIETFWPTPTTR